MISSPKRLRSLAHRMQRRVERTLYRYGNTVECPYCKWTGWRFLSAGLYRRPNRLCPGCASLERYRMIPLVLSRELGAKDRPQVLELAPKACLTKYCRDRGWRYVSSDLSSPTAMVRGDLRAMPFATGSFDVIICFHVLEHIHEDAPSFRELGRMLTPDGFGLLCVPLRGQVTQEGAPRSEWERLYGQEDHVRMYGMDIEQRMREAGLSVQRVDTLSYFTAAELERHALRGDDRYLFLVRKGA